MKFDFKNESESCSLKIYDTIGSDGWGNGITVDSIENELKDTNGKPLNIYINSNGGEVFEGFAIYNILKRYGGYKTVYIDGLAASIASVIALCGNKVVMNKASMMMIHNASGFCMGNAEEMKKVVNALEQINEVIRDIYKSKTNLSEEQIKDLMDNETFMTANECLEYGFADEIVEEEQSKDTFNNMLESIDSIKNAVDQKIKLFNDIKNMYLNAENQVGSEAIVDDEPVLNKKSHWAWLKEKEK